jgi:hypothetical protein
MTEASKHTNYNMQEINDIQSQIETYTKKIEHEKISKRLAYERYQTQLNNYLSLQGKPTMKSKEQKAEENKEKKERRENERKEKEKLKTSYDCQKENEKQEQLRKEQLMQNPTLLLKELNKNVVEIDKVKLNIFTYRSQMK